VQRGRGAEVRRSRERRRSSVRSWGEGALLCPSAPLPLCPSAPLLPCSSAPLLLCSFHIQPCHLRASSAKMHRGRLELLAPFVVSMRVAP
jgi:hypothetical protein